MNWAFFTCQCSLLKSLKSDNCELLTFCVTGNRITNDLAVLRQT